ncbi:MAG: AAA family ATPase [Myxococcota bacterium]
MHTQSLSGRDQLVAQLSVVWQDLNSGNPHIVVLEGPEGSGRSTLVSQFVSQLESKPLVLQARFAEGEDGLKALLRLYAAVFTALHDNPDTLQAARSAIDSILESAQEPVKMWLMAFKEGLDKPRPDTTSASFQVTIPRQSPLLALQEILATLNNVTPIVFELQDADHVISFSFWAFLTALADRVRFQRLPLMLVLSGQSVTDADREFIPYSPRHSFLNSLAMPTKVLVLGVPSASTDDLLSVLAAHLGTHRIAPDFLKAIVAQANGLPGQALELLELLKSLEILTQADDDAWIVADGSTSFSLNEHLPQKPLARQVLQVAALEGGVFTASLISEQLSTEKDTIDDLLDDDLEDLIEEVVHNEALNSWLYRFKNPAVRRHFLSELTSAAQQELARGIGELLERRYINASPDYAIKAARLWRVVGDGRRSTSLIGLAASAERPEVLQMGAELIKAFPQTRIAPPIYKGLHLTLFEKLITSGPVEPLLVLLQDVEQWASNAKDEEVLPWLALYNARLFHRIGRMAEAEQEAEKAHKAFARVNNPIKEADALNVLGLVALAKGDLGVANDCASRAINKTPFPPVRVQSLFIKGLVHKGRGELQQAVNQLKEALDLSGKLGMLPLHLDTGLNIAECLLVGGKPDDAVTLLNQLAEVARNTNQLGRLRAAHSLLSKGEASLRDMNKAAEHASQALRLSREMKVRPFEAADLLDLGIFSFVKGNLDEAAVYLRESEKIAREINEQRILKEVLFHHGMVFSGLKDYPRAHKAYQDALKLARELKDERREANIIFNVGGLYLHEGEYARAKTWLDQAAPLIEKSGSPDEKKALKKALEQLEVKIN